MNLPEPDLSLGYEMTILKEDQRSIFNQHVSLKTKACSILNDMVDQTPSPLAYSLSELANLGLLLLRLPLLFFGLLKSFLLISPSCCLSVSSSSPAVSMMARSTRASSVLSFSAYDICNLATFSFLGLSNILVFAFDSLDGFASYDLSPRCLCLSSLAFSRLVGFSGTSGSGLSCGPLSLSFVALISLFGSGLSTFSE